jgi:hypothetical protein
VIPFMAQAPFLPCGKASAVMELRRGMR